MCRPSFEAGKGQTRVTDQEQRRREPITFTKENAIAGYLEIAMKPPEDTKGSLRDQIHACRSMYEKFGYQSALQRLSEIANIDAARTNGRRRDQESAAKLLKNYVSSVKVGKNQGIQ
jgi:hypothetical protein